MPTKRGFSLIEVMISVVILGILASIAIPRYQNQVYQARLAEAKSNLNSIRVAQVAYYILHTCFLATRRVPPAAGYGRAPWVDVADNPNNPCDGLPHGFADMGYKMQGSARYRYQCTVRIAPPDYACSAMGDVDNDRAVSEVVFCSDYASTGSCIPTNSGAVSVFPFEAINLGPGRW